MNFSSHVIKWIACITMLLDHIGAAVFLAYRDANGGFTPLTYNIYEILRNIGRIAFPLYIFLLIQGLQHTRSAKKYLLRLTVFALLSEIPFDLAFHRTLWHPDYQNIYFTLAIGFFVTWAMKNVEEEVNTLLKDKKESHRKALLGLFYAGLTYLGMYCAALLKTDYSWVGVLAICAAWLLRKKPALQMGVCCFILLLSSLREFYAFLCLIPVLNYDGTYGKQNRYFFYFYYPVHLLLLYLIIVLLHFA